MHVCVCVHACKHLCAHNAFVCIWNLEAFSSCMKSSKISLFLRIIREAILMRHSGIWWHSTSASQTPKLTGRDTVCIPEEFSCVHQHQRVWSCGAPPCSFTKINAIPSLCAHPIFYTHAMLHSHICLEPYVKSFAVSLPLWHMYSILHGNSFHFIRVQNACCSVSGNTFPTGHPRSRGHSDSRFSATCFVFCFCNYGQYFWY